MEDEKPSAFTDLLTGAGWLLLACAMVIGAWQMDRLTHLQATIYTVPGLVPGLLGLAIGLTSVILIARALRAGALTDASLPSFDFDEHWRLFAVLLLCLVYAVGLVGHGLPFWLASALFVATFIVVFQFSDRRREGTLPGGVMLAVIVGLVSGLAIHYLFQDLFLVRLP